MPIAFATLCEYLGYSCLCVLAWFDKIVIIGLGLVIVTWSWALPVTVLNIIRQNGKRWWLSLAYKLYQFRSRENQAGKYLSNILIDVPTLWVRSNLPWYKLVTSMVQTYQNICVILLLLPVHGDVCKHKWNSQNNPSKMCTHNKWHILYVFFTSIHLFILLKNVWRLIIQQLCYIMMKVRI